MISNHGFGEMVKNPSVTFIEMYVDCAFHGDFNDILMIYV